MRVVITCCPSAVSAASSVVSALGGVVSYASRLAWVVFADVPDAAIAALRADPAVIKVEVEAPGPSVCEVPAVAVMPLAEAPWGVANGAP